MKPILLNGPPGSGKSTLARRYADDHPPALAPDVDRIRAMLGGWRTNPGEAGPLAREIALAAARTHLGPCGARPELPTVVNQCRVPQDVRLWAGPESTPSAPKAAPATPRGACPSPVYRHPPTNLVFPARIDPVLHNRPALWTTQERPSPRVASLT